ncbi:MAG: hypothetical protein HXY30_16160 [Pseudorhodoplanes sp.]|nr:hypothetical protein [Pseudorhodoplanes sp.]
MRFFQASDAAGRSGEVIGSLVTIGVIGVVAYVTLMSTPLGEALRHLFDHA